MSETIEKKLRMVDLYDHYGKLLTVKQQEILNQYCMEDLSLAEISENLEISRQAVFDAVRKAEKQLEELEKHLGMLSRQQRRKLLLDEALGTLNHLSGESRLEPCDVRRLKQIIAEALE